MAKIPPPIRQGGQTMSSRRTQGNQGTPQQLNKLAEWIESEEGQKTLRDAVNVASKSTAKLNEERRVDPEQLHQPMTV
jgi:hypothetical protein